MPKCQFPFPSSDLSDLCTGLDEIKQPCQKVNEWLKDNNPHHFFDDIFSNQL
jgi:hypothetical protein